VRVEHGRACRVTCAASERTITTRGKVRSVFRYSHVRRSSIMIVNMAHRLMGLAEIAAMLGVSRQRADVIVKTDRAFPEPVAVLSAGRIWERESVEAWVRDAARSNEGGGRLADYMSGQSYVAFRGDRAQPYQFTRWRGITGDELLVLVMEFRIVQEPSLEWVRTEGIPIDGGYMVPMAQWETRVTPSGTLR
jgi:predicted DNA-binding transcriptional regulator AlpA